MRKGAIALVAALALCVGAAEAVLIDFESDTTGSKPNGWTSVDSAICHFTDSIGADLEVDDYYEVIGRGLANFHDDAGALIMDFDVLVKDISLGFGNDHPGVAQSGDVALLTLYLGGGQVGQTAVAMNINDIMDQTIGIAGICFEQAVLVYANSNYVPINLIEAVDNIGFTVCDTDIPEPATLVMLALAGAGLAARKRLVG